MSRTLVTGIGELATPLGRGPRGGPAQGAVLRVRDAHVLIEDGRILSAGPGPGPSPGPGTQVLDAEGRLVTPGLVDPHTHLVFGGWRQQELRLRLEGRPYLDILRAGGGIHATVRATRAATPEELFKKAAHILSGMLAGGVTALEAKSGYGLSLPEEEKQLRVIRRLQETQPVTLVSTFMAAHAVPLEYRDQREAYVNQIVEEMIPAVARQGLAECCDVFCEEGVFSPQESRRVLEAARRAGLKLKIHADEVENTGGAALAGALGALSAEHLLATDDAGIRALAQGGVVACLLPGTSLYLGKPYARARALIDAGVPVAVGTDFNPGSCPCASLPLCMNLACLQYGLSPEETLTAVTLNAAAALGRAESLGSLEPGKQGDLVLWDAPDLDYLLYRLGAQIAERVLVRGAVRAVRGRALPPG